MRRLASLAASAALLVASVVILAASPAFALTTLSCNQRVNSGGTQVWLDCAWTGGPTTSGGSLVGHGWQWAYDHGTTIWNGAAGITITAGASSIAPYHFVYSESPDGAGNGTFGFVITLSAGGSMDTTTSSFTSCGTNSGANGVAVDAAYASPCNTSIGSTDPGPPATTPTAGSLATHCNVSATDFNTPGNPSPSFDASHPITLSVACQEAVGLSGAVYAVLPYNAPSGVTSGPEWLSVAIHPGTASSTDLTAGGVQYGSWWIQAQSIQRTCLGCSGASLTWGSGNTGEVVHAVPTAAVVSDAGQQFRAAIALERTDTGSWTPWPAGATDVTTIALDGTRHGNVFRDQWAGDFSWSAAGSPAPMPGATFGGGTPPTSGAACIMASVTGPLDGSKRVAGASDSFVFTWTGVAQSIVIDPDWFTTTGEVTATSLTSPQTISVTWPRTGAYSTAWRCFDNDGSLGSSGAFGGVSAPSSCGTATSAQPICPTPPRPTLTSCFDQSGIGVDPSSWVPGLGKMVACFLQVLFMPSPQTISQLTTLWANVQKKAPFSYAYDVLTFLPAGVTAANSALGGGGTCSGLPSGTVAHLGSNPGGTVAGAACTYTSQFSSIRAVILWVIVAAMAFGVYRTTVRVLG